MKVSNIVIENIRRFKERIIIDFGEGINILIGPDGKGKSKIIPQFNSPSEP